MITEEELKMEAKRLGYAIFKRKPTVKFLPCTCGHNRRTHRYNSAGEFYVCKECGRVSPSGKDSDDAKKKWNEMIQAETLG